MPGPARRCKLAEMPDFMTRTQVAGLLGVSAESFAEADIVRLGIPHVTLRRKRDRIRVSKTAFRAWERGQS